MLKRLAVLFVMVMPVMAAADEVQVTDLLDLPANEFKAGAYLRVAQMLQAVGKEKACARLRELAAKDKDDWPHTRTIVLCRMLFKAKQGSTFRRAYIGGPLWIGTKDTKEIMDWPLEPIALVDG